MICFNVKCCFAYTMKIHNYERTLLLKKYAHNVTQYKKSYVDVFTISHYESKNLLFSNNACTLILKIIILLNFSIKDYMFITSKI